jgi:cell division protein FtsZ
MKKEEVKDDRVMFTLDINPQPKPEIVSLVPVEEKPVVEAVVAEVHDQSIVEEPTILEIANVIEHTPVVIEQELIEEEKPIVFELDLNVAAEEVEDTLTLKDTAVSFFQEEQPVIESIKEDIEKPATIPTGLLVKPTVIYVEETQDEPVAEQIMPEINLSVPEVQSQEQDSIQLVQDSIELVYHEDEQLNVVEELMEETRSETFSIETSSVFDEAEAQKARAAERLHKLRNLSFNFNSSDPNNEYENIPAYVRQNLQVHNTTLASVEKFYSSYAVGTDENNVAQISTINTFLEGKKPD